MQMLQKGLFAKAKTQSLELFQLSKSLSYLKLFLKTIT